MWSYNITTGDDIGRYAGYVITDEFQAALPEAVFQKDPNGLRSLWERAILATIHNVVLAQESRIEILEAKVSELRAMAGKD